MAENFIRVKQINQSDLSGFIVNLVSTGVETVTTVFQTGQNLVYTSGNQTISGIKDFISRPTLSGTGFLLSGEGVTLSLLQQSGQALDNKINSLSGSSVLLYANQTISGNKTFIESGIFSLSGAVPLNLSGNPLTVVGSGNTFIQLNIQNRATGTTATADLVITANNGTDTSNYINLGINNSGYNDPAFNNASGLDGYLFINGGNLDIGTQTPNTNLEFHIGGTTRDKVIARIDGSGMNIVSGNYRVNNSGVLISGQNLFGCLTLGHANQTPANGGQTYYFSQVYSATPVINTTDRRFSVPRNCRVRNFELVIQTLGTYGVGAQPAISYDLYDVTNSVSVGTLFSCAACNPYTGVLIPDAVSKPYTGVQGVNVNFNLTTGNQYAIRWTFGGGYTTAVTSVNNQVNLYLE